MTIEQRAIEAQRHYKDESMNNFNKGKELPFSEWCYGYCQGATDQRKIDIEKACEWLKKSIGGELDLFRDEEDYNSWETYFRKAMEEQQ